MFKIKNLTNDNIKIIEQKENIKVLEYEKDQSLTPDLAQVGYFSEKMNIKPKYSFSPFHFYLFYTWNPRGFVVY